MSADPLDRFAEIWAVDFEFITGPGERPDPVCMVAREIRSGRVVRIWREALREMVAPPFSIGKNALYVAYSASAELSCHLALCWPLPAFVLDAYVEFLDLINGLPQRFAKGGTSQLAALAYFGLTSITADEKTHWRNRILAGPPFSAEEAVGVLDYCKTDVDGLAGLLPKLVHTLSPRDRIGWTMRYFAAGMSRRSRGWSIPACRSTCPRSGSLSRTGPSSSRRSSTRSAPSIPCGKARRSNTICSRRGSTRRIPWPRTETNRLSLSDDTFKTMSRAYPVVAPIREVRENLSSLNLSDLAVGSDGRNRTGLFPFGTRSSRNAPSNSRFVFGPSAWMRALIRPAPGMAIAYIDYVSQEVAVAAALSGDEALLRACASGDPYLAFAIEAGLAPSGATKSSHDAIRNRCKAVVLGTIYGMQAQTLASRLDISELEAKQLLAAHRRSYSRFWQWSQAAVDSAMLLGYIDTVFGWRLHVTPDSRVTSLLNHPMQSNGAEMLRLACIFATEAGVTVCAPVHDALLIEAPIDSIDAAIERTRQCMERASRIVLAGWTVATSAEKVVRYPDRYMDQRGARVWELVIGLMEKQEAA